MKKLLTLLLVAVLAVMLCACGQPQSILDDIVIEDESVDKDALRDTLDKATDYIESTVDTAKMTATTNDDDDYSVSRYWSYDKAVEIEPLITAFEIDGNKIVIGETTESQLEELGMEIDAYADTIGPEEETSITLSQGSKFCMILLEANLTDQTIPIRDLAVAGFTCPAPAYSLDFSYDGLTYSSTIDQVLAALGTPNDGISLYSDSTICTFELDYSDELQDGDYIIGDSLRITFLYNPEDNTASLYGIDMDRYTYPVPEDE